MASTNTTQGLGPAAQLALQLKSPMLLFTASPARPVRLTGKDSATRRSAAKSHEEVLRLAEQEPHAT